MKLTVMKRVLGILTVAAVVMIVCGVNYVTHSPQPALGEYWSKQKHVTAAEFQRLFDLRHVQAVHRFSYLGETNRAVYMLQESMPPDRSKRKVVLFTETNGFAPGFLEQMRRSSKLEEGGASGEDRVRR
jgi:hypothetical protein